MEFDIGLVLVILKRGHPLVISKQLVALLSSVPTSSAIIKKKMAAQTPWHEFQKKGYELEKQVESMKKQNAEIENNLKDTIETEVVLQGGYPPEGFYGIPYKEMGKIKMGYVDMKLGCPHFSEST